MELTPDLERLIIAAVRAGGYVHVAAEAAGVPRRVLRRWLARGRKDARYRQFRLSVMQARAHARLTAEWELRNKDAKTWLQNGPGKEVIDAPGWGKEVIDAPGWGKSAADAPPNDQGDLWRLLGLLNEALTPFPEARQAAAAAIEAATRARATRHQKGVPVDLPIVHPPDYRPDDFQQ